MSGPGQKLPCPWGSCLCHEVRGGFEGRMADGTRLCWRFRLRLIEALDSGKAQHVCSGRSSFVLILHADSGVQYVHASLLQGAHAYQMIMCVFCILALSDGFHSHCTDEDTRPRGPSRVLSSFGEAAVPELEPTETSSWSPPAARRR